MLAEIGLSGLALAFCAALYAVGASLYGARRHAEKIVVSARNAALLTFPLLLVAAVSLLCGAAHPAVPDHLRLAGDRPQHADLLPLHGALGVAAGVAAVLVPDYEPVRLRGDGGQLAQQPPA